MTINLSEGFSLRPASLADIEAIANLYNLCDMHDFGTSYGTAEEMAHRWQVPGHNITTDCWLVFTQDGSLIASGEIWNETGDFAQFSARGRVHPEYRRKGIGSYLIGQSETRARETIARAPADAQVVIARACTTKNLSAIALFERQGYTPVRSFYDMQIEMEGPPPTPVFPLGITIRAFSAGENDHPIYTVFNEAFQDHWGFMPLPYETWHHLAAGGSHFDPTLWFLAMHGDQIAGFALCLAKTPDDPLCAWVDDLAVRRPWRRQGIALALLNHVFGEFYRRGTRKVGLGVDASSLTNAVKLYERAGMHVKTQVHRYDKELRPGKVMYTQELDQ